MKLRDPRMLAEIFTNMERLSANLTQQLNHMSALRSGLIHEWITMSEIQFDGDTFLDLIEDYHAAIEANKDSFIFRDQELLVSYAKYLIQYLEPRFPEARVLVTIKRRAHQSRMKGKTQ